MIKLNVRRRDKEENPRIRNIYANGKTQRRSQRRPAALPVRPLKREQPRPRMIPSATRSCHTNSKQCSILPCEQLSAERARCVGCAHRASACSFARTPLHPIINFLSLSPPHPPYARARLRARVVGQSVNALKESLSREHAHAAVVGSMRTKTKIRSRAQAAKHSRSAV